MLLGYMPKHDVLEKYNVLQFHELTCALKEGNVQKFDDVIQRHESFFIECGIYLIVEKLKTIAYRNLFKRVKHHRISSHCQQRIFHEYFVWIFVGLAHHSNSSTGSQPFPRRFAVCGGNWNHNRWDTLHCGQFDLRRTHQRLHFAPAQQIGRFKTESFPGTQCHSIVRLTMYQNKNLIRLYSHRYAMNKNFSYSNASHCHIDSFNYKSRFDFVIFVVDISHMFLVLMLTFSFSIFIFFNIRHSRVLWTHIAGWK